MRSYDQYCALAKALDIVGDRWTLLVVRELLVRPCRYSELQDGLTGIATNLLAQRLRQLEAAGSLVVTQIVATNSQIGVESWERPCMSSSVGLRR